MVTGKETSAGFFLLIGGGERDGVVPVLHVGDGRLMACQSCRNATQHRSLSQVRLARGVVGLKLTRGTVPLGRAQIIRPNIFSIFQTDMNL
jgi:hypothetical protein